MLFWMCAGMSLPPMFVEDEDVVADEPFFLRRIMRGADLVVGAEPADGSAVSVAMVMLWLYWCSRNFNPSRLGL